MDIVYGLFSRMFVFILIGYLLGRIKGEEVKRAADFSINIILFTIVPCFILVVMWESNVKFSSAARVLFSSMVVVCVGLLFSWVFSRIYNMRFRDVFLPITFMNSAYFGIPLNTLLFGLEGASYTVIYSIITFLSQFTLGIYIIRGRSRLKDMLNPTIIAAFAGAALNGFNVGIPGALVAVNGVLKAVTIPIMLMLAGYQLDFGKTRVLKLAFTGTMFRFGAGLAGALLMVKLLSLEGVVSKVVISTSLMPTAVLTYLLSKKYDSNPEFASAMLLVSTLLGILVILGMGVVFI